MAKAGLLNYEPYNLIISNNYVRSRDIPASATSGVLAGGKYTRSIDVGGGGEATAETYPQPFVKIHSNYCELRSVDGVAIATGAGDSHTMCIRILILVAIRLYLSVRLSITQPRLL
ncbi:hypothetical protein [Enterobacter phage 01_vB_Eclo_IJM]|nr:hypothetical protein [Enterobacter phage 01_vB_Eclo_IJM]